MGTEGFGVEAARHPDDPVWKQYDALREQAGGLRRGVNPVDHKGRYVADVLDEIADALAITKWTTRANEGPRDGR